MANIKKIKLDNTIYDLHDAKAVHSVNGQSPDASGNVSVTAELPDGLVKYNSLSAIETVTPLNADTLETHPASYFATASDMSALQTNVSTNTNNIATNTNNISALQTKVSTNTSNIQTNTNNISTNTSNISALQTTVSGKLSKSGDTMKGALVAQNNTNYSVAQVRNIFISTADPSGGASGDIWIKYTE